MDTVLNIKAVTGTTRFYFDYRISNSTLKNLMRFFDDGSFESEVTSHDTITVKLINFERCESIEITNSYISFFPEVKDSEVLELKKSIYNIIARRSEVYFKGSIENLQAAKFAILRSDLRSTTSLLYYCLHKFMSGRYYRYLNKNLEILDIDIDITDLGHYTSEMFYKAHKNLIKERKELNKENYINIFKYNKIQMNPFIVAYYDLMNVKFPILEFEAFINGVVKQLFGQELTDFESDYFGNYVEEFQSKSKEEKTQEEEVKAAIAFCLNQLKIAEDTDEKNQLWEYYIIALRLYWLRQTADYDYDFEIKVSVRELSLILSILEASINNLLDSEEDKGIVEDIDILNKDIKDESKPQNIKTDYYKVSYNFINSLSLKNKPDIYMNCLHLDGHFNHEYTIRILNMMPEVSNLGKYFSFEYKRPIYINLFISKDGKWTFWLPKEMVFSELLGERDLVNASEVFFEKYNQLAEKIGINHEYNLLKAQPVSNFKTTNTLSLNSIKRFFESERLNYWFIEAQFKKIVKEELNLDIFNKRFSGVEFLFDVKIHREKTSISQIPFEPLNMRIVRDTDENYSIICLYLYDDEDEANLDLINENGSFLEEYSFERFGELDDEILGVKYIPLKVSGQLEIEGSSDLLEKLQDIINDTIYKLIEKENYSEAQEIFNSIVEFEKDAFLTATEGLFYFRNPEIGIDEANENAHKLYEESLKLISEEDEDLQDAFYLKFQYEKARFYNYRLYDKDRAVKVFEGIDLSEKLKIASDLEEMIIEEIQSLLLEINSGVAGEDNTKDFSIGNEESRVLGITKEDNIAAFSIDNEESSVPVVTEEDNIGVS